MTIERTADDLVRLKSDGGSSRHSVNELSRDSTNRLALALSQTSVVGERALAAPVRGADGRVAAAMNVTVHAAETSVATLTEEHLPPLLETAQAVSDEWAHMARIPTTTAS